MTETQRTRRSYDLVAGRYAQEIGDELAGKPLDRALLDALAELAGGGRLLDLGCGPGHVAGHLAARGASLVGADLSPAMCAIARRNTGLPFAAADMTALPFASGTFAGILCLYAVLHLDAGRRRAAYGEMARTLQPGGHALVAFHTSDADVPVGGSTTMTRWWDEDVELTFRYLDPDSEAAALADAGLTLVARLDRAPHAGAEHPSNRSYLLVKRS